MLAHTFEGIERLGFTTSDIAAGLALIRAVQKEEEALVVQDAVRRHLSSQVGPRHCRSGYPRRAPTHPTPPPTSARIPTLLLVVVAMHLQLAVYGLRAQ